ncbi:Protein F13C5.5, partial [Aphelenchoides avenae]
MRRLAVLVLLASFTYATLAQICPLQEHVVCNDSELKHQCVCAMTMEESPPPVQSCNLVVDIVDDEFPAASVVFNLDEAAEAYELFPEEKFRDELAKALRIEDEQIIILRLRCSEDNEKLTVQFGVLKRG